MDPAQRLRDVLIKQSRRLIGLISGMSMDGVDLGCVEVSGTFPDLAVKVLGTHFQPYPLALASELRAAQAGSIGEVSRLNFVVAAEFARCVREFLEREHLSAEEIDAIGSHGQTLFHDTETLESARSTLQVGAPSVIAELTGIITVGNFRVRDLAAGGQAAPLVSLLDYVLFRDPQHLVVLNNLGSISNLTVVTPSLDDVVAFDTGPANMAIDFFARAVPGNDLGIDAGGSLSARGICIEPLLAALMSSPFFSRPPPKAAGYGEFGPHRLAAIAAPFTDHRPEDLVRTGVEFAAATIEDAYRTFVLPSYGPPARVIFSGGGVHNATLMRRIAERLPELPVEVMPAELADAKEAVAFALLANETLSGRAGNIPSVTGARRAAVLGEIAL
jgi:anhydro-N-acetylmuramic acid kinase